MKQDSDQMQPDGQSSSSEWLSCMRDCWESEERGEETRRHLRCVCPWRWWPCSQVALDLPSLTCPSWPSHPQLDQAEFCLKFLPESYSCGIMARSPDQPARLRPQGLSQTVVPGEPEPKARVVWKWCPAALSKSPSLLLLPICLCTLLHYRLPRSSTFPVHASSLILVSCLLPHHESCHPLAWADPLSCEVG